MSNPLQIESLLEGSIMLGIGYFDLPIGYGGFLFGAPLIGTLAHMMPLDRALLAVAVLVLLIAILASVARERGGESIKAKDETLA